MLKKFLFPMAVIVSMSLAPAAFAADQQCKEDKDCKSGDVCILALTPPVCKPPQAAGAPWPVEADLADALDPARLALR